MSRVKRKTISFENLENKYKDIACIMVRDKALSQYRTLPLHTELIAVVISEDFLKSIKNRIESLILRDTESEVQVSIEFSQVLDYYKLSTR